MAADGSHGLTGGKTRSVQQPGSKSLSDAVNACLAGRPAISSASGAASSSQPSIQLPQINYLKHPFADDTIDPDAECEKLLPPKETGKCLAVIDHCKIETINGGQEFGLGLELDGSSPCNSKREILKKACLMGFRPEKFKDGDIKCSPLSK